MSSVSFSLANGLVLPNTAVVDGTITEIYNSGEQSNNSDYEGIKLVVEYGDLTPSPNHETLNPYFPLSCVIEGLDSVSGNWYPIIRQFDVLTNENQGLRQVLVAAPNVFTFDEGIPIDDWDGEKVTTRYNKKQDRLSAKWRVRILVRDSKFGTVDAFVSAKVNVYGERFNA